MSGGRPAEQRWRAELAGWAIDPAILAAAPEPPWQCPPEMFRAVDAGTEETPTRRRVREALPAGGSLLDVGCGGGAASLPLAPPAGRVVGVDSSAEMLAAFAAAAQERGAGVAVSTVAGRWPDVAGQVPTCDVAVAAHVAYNVPDLAAFAAALTDHARRRVVLELTATHPLTALGPLWERFHGQPRPAGPTADLARAVLEESGLAVREERWTAPARPLPEALRVRMARIRLCLPAEREPEVRAALVAAGEPPPRRIVTLWWPLSRGDHARVAPSGVATTA